MIPYSSLSVSFSTVSPQILLNCSDVTSPCSPSSPGVLLKPRHRPRWTDGWTRGYGLGEVERQWWAAWRASHGACSVKQQASSSFGLARRGWRGLGCSPDFMHHQSGSCWGRMGESLELVHRTDQTRSLIITGSDFSPKTKKSCLIVESKCIC